MSDENSPPKLRQRYAPDYRTIHSNGAIVTANLSGELFVGFFSEQSNLEGTFNLTPVEGGYEQGRLNRDAQWLREVEAGIFLSMPVAIELHTLLGTKIKEVMEALKKDQVEPSVPPKNEVTQE